MRLKRKENVTSTSHDGTIHSSCLTTCSVDCVTTRPKILRNSNCTRDRTTLARKDLSKPAMSAWRVSKRATPEGERSSARDSTLPKSGGKGSTRANARSAASYEVSLGRSIVALQKIEPQTRPGNPRARWGANRILARAQNPASSEGGDGSRSGLHGGSLEERERARAGTAVHARGSGIRRGIRSRGRGGAQASADDIYGVRSSEAGNSDSMLWSDQGERGVLSRRNPTAQGEGDNGVQRARSAQERGKRRGTVGRRARGKGRETRNHPDAKGQRRGSAQARGQSWRGQWRSSCETCSLHSRSDGTPPNHGQNQRRCGEDAGQ